MADFGGGIGIGGGSINIDGSGIGGGGGGSGGVHLTYTAQLFAEALRRGEVQTWEGEEADILEKFLALKVGDRAEQVRFLGEGDADWGTAFVADVRAPRRNGKVWTMQITVVQLRKAVMWTLEYAELQKDIRTWRQNAVGGDGSDEASIPDLTQIAQWERAKDIQDWDHYDAFETVDGVALADGTLKLAQMIRKGIESYTIHTPLPTMTYRYYDESAGIGGLLDKYTASLPHGPAGWTELGGGQMWEQLQELTYNHNTGIPDIGTISFRWLCVSDKGVPAGDGSTTRTIQFMRVDNVEDRLYAQADPREGGLS